KWCLVIALVACGGRSTKPPAIDVSCTTDIDCILTDDDCCTGCGGTATNAVNAKAWLEIGLPAKQKRCADTRCPYVNCARPPDCREEGRAVCKQARCELEIVPTTACATLGTTPDLACDTASDCVVQTFGADCCEHCGGEAMSRDGALRARDARAKQCANRKVECPRVDCPKTIELACIEHRCVEAK
ncbi:MAG TPA: hypothetical protein VK427_17455, partial [Kofleriaceae bacterium]|nr:hypothetical protein [Kofleriaceae bacterium]